MRSLDRFLAIAYVEGIVRKAFSIPETAKAMGMAATTLYHKLEGESVMSFDERLALVRVTGNPALRQFLLEQTGLVAEAPAKQAARYSRPALRLIQGGAA